MADVSLLTMKDVTQRLGVTPKSIKSLIRLGAFPPPFTVGKRTSVWLQSEIENWLAKVKAVTQEFAPKGE